jgi:hypothetical protein
MFDGRKRVQTPESMVILAVIVGWSSPIWMIPSYVKGDRLRALIDCEHKFLYPALEKEIRGGLED